MLGLTGLYVVPRTSVFYRFDPEIKPFVKVEPGDLVVFQTIDALGGQIRSEEDLVSAVDFTRVNPATGPLYVENAEPGDALLVEILDIKTAEKGFIVTAPGAGVLAGEVKQAKTRECRVKDDYVEVLGYRIPAWKMIGVIGVASVEKPPTGVPGKHGGNLDTKFITKGARVYLPVEYTGGLLGIGDLHAVMAHGEVCVAACEVEGEVLVRVDVVKEKAPAWPLVEYEDSTYILVSDVNTERAFEVATSVVVEVLEKALNLEWHDAYMLASVSVDFGVSQLVDPRKTVWARIPKNLVSASSVLKAISELK
ncbi:MAG: acetamidase/formamidase family protein [Desulfurococcaceae archaeon]